MADKEIAKKTAPKKSDKPSFGERIKKFFRDYGSELKKITWSSKKDVKSNTIVVVGLIIFALDMGFSALISALGKIY